MHRWIHIVTVISFAYLSTLSITYATDIKVIDADTLEYKGNKIRLMGIDAPELDQLCKDSKNVLYPCGKIAANKLDEWIKSFFDKNVDCKNHGLDRYGRTLSTCWIGIVNINSWLVSQGWAIAYRHYSDNFVTEEQNAKKNRKGVWNGSFIAPWNWRRGLRFDIKTDYKKDECLIKGNISSKGEKIYHTPSERHYTQTKINLEKGEKWFCTESEAQNKGWRKSKR